MFKNFVLVFCLFLGLNACLNDGKGADENGDKMDDKYSQNDTQKTEADMQAPAQDPNVKFLALGDSYTIGESVAPEERWPAVLAEKLKEEGISIEAPKIIATTGWTTDELRKGIEKEQLKENFGLVSLLIGVNNQFRGFETEIYEEEFKLLLDLAIGYANGDPNRVFVVSIPDYGVTRFGSKFDTEKISVELDYYNKVNKTISEQAGVTYFNITGISRLAVSDPELVAEDELHPSGKMYRQWVDMMLPGVKAMLK